jgi:hypothetical protein
VRRCALREAAPSEPTVPPEDERGQPPPLPPIGRLVAAESDLAECWLNVGLSFLIGMLGSLAFHIAVHTGFIGRDYRDQLLQHLIFQRDFPYIVPLLFWLFGGVTAAIFQAAQPSILVPVQSFVLGATWTSVINQMMAGRSERAPLFTPPPSPTGGGTAPAAEVVIPPAGTPPAQPTGPLHMDRAAFVCRDVRQRKLDSHGCRPKNDKVGNSSSGKAI